MTKERMSRLFALGRDVSGVCLLSGDARMCAQNRTARIGTRQMGRMIQNIP
jgi:hypothetical protein